MIFLAAAILLLARLTGLGVLKTLVLALLAHAALELELSAGALLHLSNAVAGLRRVVPAQRPRCRGRSFARPDLRLETVRRAVYLLFRRPPPMESVLGNDRLGGSAHARSPSRSSAGRTSGSSRPTSCRAASMARWSIPYNPGLGSAAVLLRRIFVPEPELNPHPLLNAPAAFFFFEPVYARSAGLRIIGVAEGRPQRPRLRLVRDRALRALARYRDVLISSFSGAHRDSLAAKSPVPGRPD